MGKVCFGKLGCFGFCCTPSLTCVYSCLLMVELSQGAFMFVLSSGFLVILSQLALCTQCL